MSNFTSKKPVWISEKEGRQRELTGARDLGGLQIWMLLRQASVVSGIPSPPPTPVSSLEIGNTIFLNCQLKENFHKQYCSFKENHDIWPFFKSKIHLLYCCMNVSAWAKYFKQLIALVISRRNFCWSECRR